MVTGKMTTKDDEKSGIIKERIKIVTMTKRDQKGEDDTNKEKEKHNEEKMPNKKLTGKRIKMKMGRLAQSQD